MSVYFYGCITLDGYLADKNHSLEWLFQTGSTEETDYESFYQSMDVTIMGRRTFKTIEQMENASGVYAATENFVFTHDETLPVQGFIPVNLDVVEFVKQIEPGKNIWVIGGNTILAPLLDQDMVDVLVIQIAPVLLGNGIPLFSQKEAMKRFHLEDVKKYGQFAELYFKKL